MSETDLNFWITTLPFDEDTTFKVPKQWKRFNISSIDTYLGDDKYVVTVHPIDAITMDDIGKDKESVEEVVVKYLRAEGFLNKHYLYLGMQGINVEGFTL